MKRLSEQTLAEAFALSTARGADLLARLGSFNVWQGDLATMRGDNPHTPNPDDESEGPARAREFFDTLVLVRAIELLQPSCRASLAAVYAERKDTASRAADLKTEPVDAQRLLTNCEHRLVEIYESLVNDGPDETASVPQWISEREHAPISGSRRR